MTDLSTRSGRILAGGFGGIFAAGSAGFAIVALLAVRSPEMILFALFSALAAVFGVEVAWRAFKPPAEGLFSGKAGRLRAGCGLAISAALILVAVLALRAVGWNVELLGALVLFGAAAAFYGNGLISGGGA